MNGGVVLMELDYSFGIKQSNIWRHYSLQNVFILKTIKFLSIQWSILPPTKNKYPLFVETDTH